MSSSLTPCDPDGLPTFNAILAMRPKDVGSVYSKLEPTLTTSFLGKVLAVAADQLGFSQPVTLLQSRGFVFQAVKIHAGDCPTEKKRETVVQNLSSYAFKYIEGEEVRTKILQEAYKAYLIWMMIYKLEGLSSETVNWEEVETEWRLISGTTGVSCFCDAAFQGYGSLVTTLVRLKATLFELHSPIFQDAIHVIQALLEAGISVNHRDQYGYTMLHYAVANVNLELTEMLLRFNVDPTLKNFDGYTPFRLTEDENGNPGLLYSAIEKNRLSVIRAILISENCKVHYDRFNQRSPFDVWNWQKTTPLSEAVRVQDVITARLLLESGANPNFGFPLHLAMETKNQELVKLLLAYGANVHHPDSLGRTPLYLASQHRFEVAIKSLVDKGAVLIDPFDYLVKYPEFRKFQKKEAVAILQQLEDNPERVNTFTDHDWDQLEALWTDVIAPQEYVLRDNTPTISIEWNGKVFQLSKICAFMRSEMIRTQFAHPEQDQKKIVFDQEIYAPAYSYFIRYLACGQKAPDNTTYLLSFFGLAHMYGCHNLEEDLLNQLDLFGVVTAKNYLFSFTLMETFGFSAFEEYFYTFLSDEKKNPEITLDPETVMETLRIAEKFNAKFLKKRVLEFIEECEFEIKIESLLNSFYLAKEFDLTNLHESALQFIEDHRDAVIKAMQNREIIWDADTASFYIALASHLNLTDLAEHALKEQEDHIFSPRPEQKSEILSIPLQHLQRLFKTRPKMDPLHPPSVLSRKKHIQSNKPLKDLIERFDQFYQEIRHQFERTKTVYLKYLDYCKRDVSLTKQAEMTPWSLYEILSERNFTPLIREAQSIFYSMAEKDLTEDVKQKFTEIEGMGVCFNELEKWVRVDLEEKRNQILSWATLFSPQPDAVKMWEGE